MRSRGLFIFFLFCSLWVSLYLYVIIVYANFSFLNLQTDFQMNSYDLPQWWDDKVANSNDQKNGDWDAMTHGIDDFSQQKLRIFPIALFFRRTHHCKFRWISYTFGCDGLKIVFFLFVILFFDSNVSFSFHFIRYSSFCMQIIRLLNQSIWLCSPNAIRTFVVVVY